MNIEYDTLMDTIIDVDPNIIEFKEFCVNLNTLGSLIDPELYFEAMVDTTQSVSTKIKKAVVPFKNTVDTTKDIVKSYNTATDGGGNLIKSVWELVMKTLTFSAKILKYILNNLAKIPKMIIHVFKSILSIPEDVKNKIQGNITLYITIDDINLLYSKLLPIIDGFIKSSENIAKGEMWGTFFRRRAMGDSGIKKYIPSENDMSYHKKMKSFYNNLALIKFEKTVIQMNDPKVIDIYFGDTKSIKYKDSKNKSHESNYYDALINIFKYIEDQSEFLHTIDKDISIKFDKTKMNQSFGRLNDDAKANVTESINMISKLITIIGNLSRYVIIDISTLKNAINSILNNRSVKKLTNPKSFKPA